MATLPIVPATPIVAKKPAVDPSTLVYKDLLDGPFWQRIPAYASVDRGAVPRSQLAGEELDHERPRSCSRRCRSSSPPAFIDDAERGLQARADVRPRQPVPALAHRLDEPVRRIRSASSSSRSPRGCLPDHPKLDLDSLHEQADAPVPGLTHRYPDKALFLAARHLPRLLPLLHAQLRGRRRHRRGREGQPQGHEERWERAFAYIASRPELEDIVISGGDAYQLRAQQIDGDRRRAPRDAEHPPHALRDQGPGGDAAEAPHRRRVDRRAHRASSRRAASSTRRSCSTRTSTTRTRSPASPRTR